MDFNPPMCNSSHPAVQRLNRTVKFHDLFDSFALKLPLVALVDHVPLPLPEIVDSKVSRKIWPIHNPLTLQADLDRYDRGLGFQARKHLDLKIAGILMFNGHCRP